jgi:hypothetical protein
MSEESRSQGPREFAVDSSRVSTAYANFARVTGTPEELVLDFGLNTQMTPNPNDPVRLTHRLVLNYYTAKRLLAALSMAVQQHEGVYGVLETDVQKRMRVQPGRPGGTQG